MEGGDVDFSHKPGARDGKPHKGTRRNLGVHNKEYHTVTALPEGQAKIGNAQKTVDEATGMRHNVQYSVNKGKRWEMVDELKKKEEEQKKGDHGHNDDDEDGGEDDGKKERHHHVHDMKVRGPYLYSLDTQDGPKQVEADKHARERLQEKEKEAAEDPDNVIKTRKGPQVKQNKSKKSQHKKSEDVGHQTHQPEVLYVVAKSHTTKDTKYDKNLTRDGCSGNRGCSCCICNGWEEKTRAKKNQELLERQLL